MAIMNYNKWFYNQHKYLKNSRDGIENFNDTKWIDTNKRFRSLIDMESELVNEQPFLINANNTGFDKLIDLMGRSNYTFEDLNESMKETYRMSLQNAMSRNLVNTHAVIFHTTNNDTKNVSSEKFTHYRIIDAPFNQLHFGHRDEFIRQKLQEMYTTSMNNYVDINEFNNSPIAKILNFSIICSVNGYFCNDCFVAISDAGFKFKIGWPYASDVDFIVYKLDHAVVYNTEIESKYISDTTVIPYNALGINDDLNGMKCIVNIYNKFFTKTSPSVPNFGVFTDKGLMLRNLQKTTIETLARQNTSKVTLNIFALKFFHEIPDLYPAVNYVDIMDSRPIYDERYESIKTKEGYRVVASSTTSINYLETCTPPIAIDRNTRNSFNTIIKCLSLYNDMMQYNDDMNKIGQGILYGNAVDFNDIYKPLLSNIYQALLSMFKTYQQGAIITSLVPSEKIDLFSNLLNNIRNLLLLTNYDQIQQYTFDELYESNYKTTVLSITEPFHHDSLSVFESMADIASNYFDTGDNSTRFNRPISEDCFITLRYHRDENCWLFDYPEIKHFHGIGNTFYIDSHLKGDEIFKFFVLYSDTEAPSEEDIEHFDLDTVLDFDLFSDEVEKHLGCIRYWNAENTLLKITSILYNKYDDETCVQVLSKILKRKIQGNEIINVYPSDINYEESNATTDNFENYTEDSDRGPFGINFLFYTLSLLNDNVDKLQSYFYRSLTKRKFNNRYSDIDISSLLVGDGYPLNYSEFTIAPTRPSTTSTVSPSLSAYGYYGLPFILNNSGENMYEPYRYVLNSYDPLIEYPSVVENGIDKSYYTQYDDISQYSGATVVYHDNIYVGKLMTMYLSSVYDYISELQTNYRTSFNQSSVIESAIDTINQHISDINEFTNDADLVEITDVASVNDVVTLVTENNNFIERLNQIQSLINDIMTISYNNLNMSIMAYINTNVLGILKQVYINTGFDNNAMNRARMLYIHLKKINEPMNAYQFNKWINEIDMHIINNLDDMVANNPNFDLSNDTFKRIYDTLNDYIGKVIGNDLLTELNTSINDLSVSFKVDHIDYITEFCDDIINKVIFDLYTIRNIEFDNSIQYNTKPAFAVIQIPQSDHTIPPIGTKLSGTKNLVFQTIIGMENNKYVIRSLSNICEYLFFDGTDLTNLTMTIVGQTGGTLGTQTVSITFNRTASTADMVNTFYQVPNVNTESIEFQNTHESFEVVNNLIVNEKRADMNYELLVGNHFVQLDHEIEYILEPETWLPGSVDKLYIDNQLINRMSMSEFGHKKCYEVYFKPCQVIHIEPKEDGSIDSIFGKYFVGQTIYLKTTDGLYSFPAKITAIDHSINKGFIEAEVDSWNSEWFRIDDKSTITQYLTNNIECEIVDDNVRNFLDEFSNEDYKTFNNPGYNSDVVYDENIDNAYKLPGDPIFVSSNMNFVYTRLKWMFNELVPDRFIDDEHKQYRFIYVTNGFINNAEDELKINMINHDFNNTTLPERYPVLRDEPNDHEVWNREVATFDSYIKETTQRLQPLGIQLAQAEYDLSQAVTIYEKELCIKRIDKIKNEITKLTDFIDRLTMYKNQLESPTTWFNVHSYNAALVYIANGRSDQFSPHFISNIRDLLYTDKINVFLYDWEHKHWIDPSTYEMEYEIIDNVKIDEYDDYTTNRVLYTFTIKPLTGFEYSKKILVYFAYNKSDVYNDIEMNDPTCFVKFKPLLSLDTKLDNYNPYSDIYIRKQFDGYEKYQVDAEDIHVKRVKHNGKYTYAPTYRVSDIKIHDSLGDHTYEDIAKFMVPNQFGFDTTQRELYKPSYTARIRSDIDSFVDGAVVKLISISNNDKSSYDGNISSVMFKGITHLDNDNQTIEIIGSTLPNYATGAFVCTVFQDDMYEPVGGVISVTVTHTSENIYGEWITVPLDYMRYREIPDEFKIIMKNPTTGDVTVTLENKYIKTSDDEIDIDNIDDNPYEYYYDQKNLVRLPISDVRTNSNDQRFVVDTSSNTDVKVIKSPYIGICRYSVNRIPEDGSIDLTGYVATPLSRDRYEFWINGRNIKNPKDLIITSPTSIQLCNMKSLKNFEVIELVDDINTDNDLFKQGNVYVDLNGNTYSNYRLALLSNSKIRKQDIKFTFNANVHKSINDHTKSIIANANNKDFEQDILDYVTFDDSNTDYNKLYNIPSINGTSLFHPKLQDLGIDEVSNDEIIREFDRVWRIEAVTNPFFFTTHRNGSINDVLKLNVKLITEPNWNGLSFDTTGMYVIYAAGKVDSYFSLYISKTSDGVIDDIVNTVKIIPFISPGVYVLIDPMYEGMWLHSTHENTKPVHIINTNPT